MIGRIHNCFTKAILSNIDASPDYILWGLSPDEDLTDWHRFKYHRISSFPNLYSYYIQKYDMRNALDTKTASVMLLGHLYIDAISGPISVFDGLNVTINHKLLDAIDKHGYIDTIGAVHRIITRPSKEYIDAVCDEFSNINTYKSEIYYMVFWNRLKEETIGLFETAYIPLTLELEKEYEKAYSEFLVLEDKLIEHMFSFSS